MVKCSVVFSSENGHCTLLATIRLVEYMPNICDNYAYVYKMKAKTEVGKG